MLSPKPLSTNSKDAPRTVSNTALADLSQPKREQLSMGVPAFSLRSCGFPCGVRAVSATLIEVYCLHSLNCGFFVEQYCFGQVDCCHESSVCDPCNCSQSSSHLVKHFRAPVCRMLGTSYSLICTCPQTKVLFEQSPVKQHYYQGTCAPSTGRCLEHPANRRPCEIPKIYTFCTG